MILYAIRNTETDEYIGRYSTYNDYSKVLPRFWYRRKTCEKWLNDSYYSRVDSSIHEIVTFELVEVREED